MTHLFVSLFVAKAVLSHPPDAHHTTGAIRAVGAVYVDRLCFGPALFDIVYESIDLLLTGSFVTHGQDNVAHAQALHLGFFGPGGGGFGSQINHCFDAQRLQFFQTLTAGLTAPVKVWMDPVKVWQGPSFGLAGGRR